MSIDPDMIYKQIAKNAKTIREERGLTQGKVAEQTGVGSQHISAIERNKTKLSVPVLVNLSTALDIDIRILLGEKVAPIPFDDEIAALLREATPRQRAECLAICRTVLTFDENDDLSK